MIIILSAALIIGTFLAQGFSKIAVRYDDLSDYVCAHYEGSNLNDIYSDELGMPWYKAMLKYYYYMSFSEVTLLMYQVWGMEEIKGIIETAIIMGPVFLYTAHLISYVKQNCSCTTVRIAKSSVVFGVIELLMFPLAVDSGRWFTLNGIFWFFIINLIIYTAGKKDEENILNYIQESFSTNYKAIAGLFLIYLALGRVGGLYAWPKLDQAGDYISRICDKIISKI